MYKRLPSRLAATTGVLLVALAALSAPARPAAAAGGTLSINDVSVTEGNSGTINATFTITLSVPDAAITTVSYTTANGTATTPADYIAATGTATIAANATTTTISIAVVGDTLDEANETFSVNLSNASANAAITDAQGIGTIVDNDATPSLRISDTSLLEGSAGTTNASFTVTLSAASGQAVSVTYATSNGTATAATDYIAAPATVLTFDPGDLVKTIAIPIIGDVSDEVDETFNVNLSGALNASIADSKGVGTILDDDSPPTISVDDQQVIEGNSGTVSMAFNISLSAPSGKTVTVKYQTADSTAAAPDDYTAVSLKTLTFSPGVQTQNVSVLVKGDTIPEGNETFLVNLSAPTNATILDGQGVGTILDDDPLPTVTIGDVTVAEPLAGTTTTTFTVSLSTATSRIVSVPYLTQDNTATSNPPNPDYQATSGTLVFQPGITTLPITVVINSDAQVEPNETFFVNLGTPANATLADGQGTGTITGGNLPTVSIGDAGATEGNGISAVFTVQLSAASNQDVTVTYSVAGGTAVAGSDFQLPLTNAITIPANTLAQTIAVPILDDPLDENDETFSVTLTGATGAAIADGVGTGTIRDNDAPPTMSIGDAQVSDSGSTPVAIFSVTLSGPSGLPISVDYQTANGTATAGQDYQAKSGTLQIASGATSATIEVPIVTDSASEGNETFLVNLGNAKNATLTKSAGTGTISDAPQAPQPLVYVALIRR